MVRLAHSSGSVKGKVAYANEGIQTSEAALPSVEHRFAKDYDEGALRGWITKA